MEEKRAQSRSRSKIINVKRFDIGNSVSHEKIRMELNNDIFDHVNNRINNEVLQKIETPSMKNEKFLHSSEKYRDKRKSSKKDALPDKEFLVRESLLTDLFEVPHIRTIYNLCIIFFISIIFNTVVTDIMESRTIRVGNNALLIGFTKFSMCTYTWLFMQASTLSVYVPFTLWAHGRQQFLPKSSIQKFWDYGWLSAFVLYQVLFLVFPVKVVSEEDFSIGCSLIIIMEQMRMMMKTHAFVRTVAPRFLSYKPHSETPPAIVPKFSQYLYFLFVPTLVYRDEYPRTNEIRWTVVIRNFVEVGVCIFCLAFIVERFIIPIYYTFDTQPRDWKSFIKNIVESSFIGVLLLIIAQYLLLHSWMNAWAEMLRFADRLFYKDWWNSTTYREFYRTWNLVVHDWLYTYIYKDMYDIVVPGNRSLSAITVFLVSAIFHEYMFAFTLRFFYPVLFILFAGIGLIMFFVSKYVTSNIFVWMSWAFGNGIMLSLYTMETHARWNNCPPHSNYYLDLFIPRSWSC
ncbi:sterol O-acyltransferase 1 [Monomorium pharaonis]|uniref:sterol O-acyltransferase 1 n=1 Tax=Monomorium pharaonis TaxID=307658 RepID=UPI00063F3244|nr:sterol O-acyltransferase 1 [Monomorium pharaonis]